MCAGLIPSLLSPAPPAMFGLLQCVVISEPLYLETFILSILFLPQTGDYGFSFFLFRRKTNKAVWRSVPRGFGSSWAYTSLVIYPPIGFHHNPPGAFGLPTDPRWVTLSAIMSAWRGGTQLCAAKSENQWREFHCYPQRQGYLLLAVQQYNQCAVMVQRGTKQLVN